MFLLTIIGFVAVCVTYHRMEGDPLHNIFLFFLVHCPLLFFLPF